MDSEAELRLRAWETGMQNMRSFNDILTRIRTLAMLYAGAVISAALAAQWASFEALGLFLMLVNIPWLLLFIFDRYYYHALLRGTVAQVIEMEHELLVENRISALTEPVKQYNHSETIFGFFSTGGAKISLFYGVPVVISTFFAMGLWLESHLNQGKARWGFLNEHAPEVSLAMALFMAAAVGFIIFGNEIGLMRKGKKIPAKMKD